MRSLRNWQLFELMDQYDINPNLIGIELTEQAEAVLKSLIHLAKSIECELLAEGVEREEEADFLRANDCSILQGYLYEGPLKIIGFEQKYIQDSHKHSAQITISNGLKWQVKV